MSDEVPHTSRRERRLAAERTMRAHRTDAPSSPALMEPSPTAYTPDSVPAQPAAQEHDVERDVLQPPDSLAVWSAGEVLDSAAAPVDSELELPAESATTPETVDERELPAPPPVELTALAQWDLPDERILTSTVPAEPEWEMPAEPSEASPVEHVPAIAPVSQAGSGADMEVPAAAPAHDLSPGRGTRRVKARPWWRHVLDFIIIAVCAALVAALLKAVAFRTFEVPSESMNPTLMTNDRMVVELISPRFNGYQRGDVVVFRDIDDWVGDGAAPDTPLNLLQLLGILPESNGYIVKRVLAVPGETIEGLGDGTLLINGEEIADPYAPRSEQEPFTWTLSDGEYWMMGDNRLGSADSRMHGPVAEENLVGKVAFRFFPFDRFGALE